MDEGEIEDEEEDYDDDNDWDWDDGIGKLTKGCVSNGGSNPQVLSLSLYIFMLFAFIFFILILGSLQFFFIEFIVVSLVNKVT